MHLVDHPRPVLRVHVGHVDVHARPSPERSPSTRRAGPNATPAEVREALRYLGNLNWNVATDPDPTHEPLLDVSRIGPLGTFSLTPAGSGPTAEGGNTVLVPFSIVRSETFFERVSCRSRRCRPAGPARPSRRA